MNERELSKDTYKEIVEEEMGVETISEIRLQSSFSYFQKLVNDTRSQFVSEPNQFRSVVTSPTRTKD